MANRRYNKTGKQNRANYIYYDAYGKRIAKISPGIDGVSTADIAYLHAEDDEQFNAQRREDYHVPVHYNSYNHDDSSFGEDHNSFLADTNADPAIIICDAIDMVEKKLAFHCIWSSLSHKQRALIEMKACGKTNVEIALSKGVTEAAIRKQLHRIRRHFELLRE